MKKPKGIKWDSLPLGRVSDGTIARMVGVTREAVGAARRRRGIPPVVPAAMPARDYDAVVPEMGKVPDATLARALGVSRATIQRQRDSRAIAPYGKDPLG